MSERKGLVEVVEPRCPEGRVFVVGDLHGAYQTFMEKLVLLEFDFEKDLVICVGDIVDRGRENLQCIKLLNEPWFKSVRGNHEDFCIVGSYDSHIANIHKDPRNGGAWLYKLSDELIEGIATLFIGLPLAMEVQYKGNLYGFTHADMPFTEWGDLYITDDSQVEVHGRTIQDWLLWSRFGYDTKDEFTEVVNGVKAVFHGHTPTCGKIEKRGNEVYVDYGHCFGYDLCVVELEEACRTVGIS